MNTMLGRPLSQSGNGGEEQRRESMSDRPARSQSDYCSVILGSKEITNRLHVSFTGGRKNGFMTPHVNPLMPEVHLNNM
jgi:hypothetical protein